MYLILPSLLAREVKNKATQTWRPRDVKSNDQEAYAAYTTA